MIRAILFDLDDTLLGNPLNLFVPSYFRLLAHELEHIIPPERLISELRRCTDYMVRHPDPTRTNADAFWGEFVSGVGHPREELEPLTSRFYEERFPTLERFTTRKPEARPIVEIAFRQGHSVVVATNPLFPRRAIEHRLAWAGVPVTDFSYALVTTYETMHACKPHAAYYQEILQTIGVAADEAIMVGDEPEMDMAARAVGIHTFWINERTPEKAAPPLAEKHGSLADFGRLLESQQLG